MPRVDRSGPLPMIPSAHPSLTRPGWDVVGPLMALVVAGTQTGASIGFAAVIERAANVYEEEISALPIDDEVG